jgi:tetratricopeptide (TPR) repeat protein
VPSLRLYTLEVPALSGPGGPIALEEPHQLALLIRLAGAPGRRLGTDDLLLCLWPELNPRQGRERLRHSAQAITQAAGTPLLLEAGDTWTLSSDLHCDLDRATAARAPGFLRGFGLPDTPEWEEWADAMRREIAARPATSPRRLSSRLLALPAAFLVLAGGYVLTRSRPVGGFHTGDRVILADVENTTGDSTLGRSLQTVAVVGLQQSAQIELYPRSRVLESLRSAGQSPVGGLTLDLALDAAARDAVPWVVTIAAAPDRDRTAVTTRLIRAATRKAVLTATGSATGTLDLVEVVDHTLRALQRGIGESAERLRAQPPLAYATTSDMEALLAYSEGAAAWRRSEFRVARDYWERAVTLDTGFAMAMGSLGAYHYYQHDREEGERYYREALARIGRLTEWERLRIESGYAEARGDLDSALALDRRIAARYPRADTYYSLGTGLLQMGRCREALEALQRSRELNSSNPNTYINIATCHTQLNEYEAARDAYLAAARLDSAALYRGNVNLEYAGALVRTGRVAEAESALVRMSRGAAMGDQALGFRGLGFLDFWRGAVAQARDHFQRAAAISRQQSAPNSQLRSLALVMTAERAAGDRAAVRRHFAELDSLARVKSLAATFLTLAVGPHADEGDAPGTRALLDQMRRRVDPRSREDSVHLHYAAGTVALMAGDPRGALAEFDQANGFRFPATLAVRRAAALERLGQLDSARIALRAVIAHPEFGFEDEIAWIRALIEVGDLEERLGRVDAAVASYRRFLDHWKDADPALPDVVRVRARLNALLGRRDQ